MLGAGCWCSTAMLRAGITQPGRMGPSTSDTPSQGSWWVLGPGTAPGAVAGDPGTAGDTVRSWDLQSASARGAGPHPDLAGRSHDGLLTAPTAQNPQLRPSRAATEVTPPPAPGCCHQLPRARGPTVGSARQKGLLSPGTSGQVMEVLAGRAAQPGITAGRKRCSVRPANVLIPFNSPAAACPCAWPLWLGSLWYFPPPPMHTGLFPTSFLGVVLEKGEGRSPAAPKCCKRTS